jgi:hypothetical protein
MALGLSRAGYHVAITAARSRAEVEAVASEASPGGVYSVKGASRFRYSSPYLFRSPELSASTDFSRNVEDNHRRSSLHWFFAKKNDRVR